jgi:gliding motility-associated-like protein
LLYRKILPVILLLALYTDAICQSSNPNIDFEAGNTSAWHYFIGFCCPIATPGSTPAITNRHTITTGSTLDPYGFFPIVAPDGGSYSLKLGNDINGSQAEKARYYIHVPGGSSDFMLIYRYAVVFQDPGHLPAEQPRFEVKAYDSITNNLVPCAQFLYVSDSNLPGFNRSTVDTSVYYRGWSSGSINLSGLGGSTIIIDFATADCGYGGHFGYGYLDMTYGLFAITAVACDTDSITLTAPPGYNVYAWYDSTTNTFIDTTRLLRVPNPSVPTTYKIVMQPYVGYGCPDSIYTRVVHSNLSTNPSNDTTICPGDTISLHMGATDTALPLTYSWLPSTGISCPTCDTISVAPLVNTQYVVSVTNPIGCSNTDTINVSMAMSIDRKNDTVLCKGTTITLNTAATGSLPLTYAWSPPSGLSCTGCPSPVANPSVTTTYFVAVKNATGCTIKDTIKVTRDDIGIIPMKDTAICLGNSITLHSMVTGTALPFLYNWLSYAGLSCTACSDPIASPTAKTTFFMRATDIFGCPVTDTVTVSVGNIILDPTPAKTICLGAGTTLSPGAISDAMPLTYSWAPAAGLNCDNCADPFANPLATTIYTVTIVDTLGCRQQTAINITVDTLLVNPMNDTTICRGFPLVLYAHVTNTANGLKYSWSPDDELNCPNCTSAIAMPRKSLTYTITVTDSNSCIATDTVRITIDPCDITIPNAFTPNGDGLNDLYRVYGHLDYFRNYSFSIYNRWGERVYYTEDVNGGWNGVYQGVDQELGTYFYMVLYTLYDEKHMMKGDFHLIR